MRIWSYINVKMHYRSIKYYCYYLFIAFFNVLYMTFVNCAERILGPVPQSEGWLALIQDQEESFAQTFLL